VCPWFPDIPAAGRVVLGREVARFFVTEVVAGAIIRMAAPVSIAIVGSPAPGQPGFDDTGT
jgi:hypothetical protein